MTCTAEVAKLAKLRAKTDRQLVGLVRAELRNGRTLIRVSGSNPALLARAADRCELVSELLPALNGVDARERLVLQKDLDDLQEYLSSVSSEPSVAAV